MIAASRGVGAQQPRAPLALVRDRNVGPFLLGNLASNLGTWMHNIAAAIVVFDVSGSAFQVGLLVLAQFGPAVVLAPMAGVLTDRVDRRRLLMVFQTLASVAGISLATSIWVVGVEGLPGVWPLHAASLVIGVGYAFSIPSHQALVAELVPAHDLEGALALNTVTFNLGRAVGPAIGAVVLVVSGPAVAFMLNSVSYLLFVFALAFVTLHPTDRPSLDRNFASALRFVRQDRQLVLLITAVAALGYAQDPVNTLAPPLAQILGGGDALVGALVSAFGVGSVLAAMTVNRVRRRLDQQTLGALGFLAVGVGMLGLSIAPDRYVAFGALLVAGAGFLFAITALTARIYQRVPDAMRGRVLSLWGIAFLGSRPVAGLIDGAIADWLSVRIAVAVGAAVAFLAAWAVRPSVRRSAPHDPGGGR